MKIHLLSDLHLEFGPFDFQDTDADLIILAGDTHTGHSGLQWALDELPDKPILYLLGNHEFIHQEYPGLIHELKELARDTHIHILENDVYTQDGYHFFGATLWTDLDLYGDPVKNAHDAAALPEYSYAAHSETQRRLEPHQTRQAHLQTIDALESHLQSHPPERTVILTHHAPSKRSVHPRYLGSPMNVAFASHLDPLIEKHQPLLWLHGHMHDPVHYTIGNTPIIANPRGYPDEENPFNPTLILDLENL